MCAELHGNHINFPTDLSFCYLALPFGWNGAPANFAIFGEAVSAIHPHCGTTSPHWYRPFPFLSRSYVGDGMFFGPKIRPRQESNTSARERIEKGLKGETSIGDGGILLACSSGKRDTLIGYDIDSANLTVCMREAKVLGARLLIGKLYGHFSTIVLAVRTLQQVRGLREHFRAQRHVEVLDWAHRFGTQIYRWKRHLS